MTLGKLIDLLKARPQDQEVYYDFAWMMPTTCHSWRGDYSELAIGWRAEGKAPTVAEVIAELEGADGKTFQGWKGGDYLMRRSTRIWVENYGDGGYTAIDRIADCDYRTIIETKYEDY